MHLLKERIPFKYKNPVTVPPRFQKFLWDHPDGKAPLEKFVLRILTYGSFLDIKWLYKKHPEETTYVAKRYNVRRGVKFWIKYWSKHGKT